MKNLSLLFFLILLFSVDGTGQDIIFKGSALEIESNFSYLPDSLEFYLTDSIINGSQDERFIKALNPIDKPAAINVFWLKFTISNDTDFDREFVLDFENWAYVDFYAKNDITFYKKQSGHLFPYNRRDYPVANRNYIRLPIQSGKEFDCYVKLTDEKSITKIPQRLDFSVSTSELVDKNDAQIGKVIYGFLGVFVVMFLYNLFIFIVTRQRSYAFYLGVILCAFYFTSNNSGYNISLFNFLEHFPFWASKFEYIGSNIAAIIYLFFLQSLMKTKTFYPKWNKFLVGLIIGYFSISILFYIFFDLAYALFSLIAVVTLVFVISLGLRCIKDKRPSAIYLLFGYIFNALGVFSILFVIFGILPKNNFTSYYGLPLGLTIEMLFYSFALANIINVLRKDNEEKQKKNIEQLLENQNLQSKVNRELEVKVKERTSELNDSLNKLHETQDQLVLKEKLASLGELTAGIAHEIQNPLNFVNNFSQLTMELSIELADEVAKDEMDKPLILDLLSDIGGNQEKINHHGERASAIVRSMLQHSQKNGGEKQPTGFNQFTKENLNISYNIAVANDASFFVEIINDFDDSIQDVELIPQDFSRVLLNIFNNSFYAVKSKFDNNIEGYLPRIHVQTCREKDNVQIRIFDNGGGIPEEIISKIFQPFFTTKPTGEGTGLGLSISYEIIAKGHGGDLTVRSKEGEYTEIIITIPA